VKGNSIKRSGVLSFYDQMKGLNVDHVEVLSLRRDLKEAAANLYESLHKLDNLNLDVIVAERLPDFGLGKSINDRLERASK